MLIIAEPSEVGRWRIVVIIKVAATPLAAGGGRVSQWVLVLVLVRLLLLAVVRQARGRRGARVGVGSPMGVRRRRKRRGRRRERAVPLMKVRAAGTLVMVRRVRVCVRGGAKTMRECVRAHVLMRGPVMVGMVRGRGRGTDR